MRTLEQGDEDFLLSGGRWWRFTRYEVRNGFIRPAGDAQFETYDPWELYRSTRNRGDEWIPPYADFVNLRDKLGLPIDESREHILAWCARYGLPGALLHQVRMATLAPRWVSVADEGAVLVPGQLQFVRTNTGWLVRRRLFRPASVEHSFGRPELENSPVPHDAAPEAWARVGVLWQGLRSPDVSHEALRETWWKFFPDVLPDQAEIHAYPAPLSEDFWRSYAEPYSVFLETMQCLTEALWDVGHHKPHKEMSREEAKHVASGLNLLHGMLAPASPTMVPNPDGSFSRQWVCGSLLSAFAMMALQDLTESRRVRGCDACGRLFTSQHPAALYCSGPCRWKSQKRRQRQKAKRKTDKMRGAVTRTSRRERPA